MAGINLWWRATPASVEDSVRNACAVAVDAGFARIAMPVIGAGSGGLNEDDALACMLTTLRGLRYPLEVTVVRFRVRERVGVRAR